MKIKRWICLTGCIVLLCGCTKSNIVQPDEAPGPDFNIYTDLKLDMDQLHEDVEDIYLDQDEFPMASAIDFELHPDEGYVTVNVVVKNRTSSEDASCFADAAIKGINDQAAIQDFSYRESSENSFGGLYQDQEIRLKVYEESAYMAGREPMYETDIEKNTYVKIDIP